MTFKQGLKKKYGRGLLGSLFLYLRIWHLFQIYAREYEKSLDQEGKRKFREVFGEG